MKLHYGVPYWLDCVPRNGTPCYPKHKAHLDVDVAIVGGGLTGCATAYVFSAAGVRVGLFETDHLAAFNTGHSLGLLLQEPQVEFRVWCSYTVCTWRGQFGKWHAVQHLIVRLHSDV